TTTRRIASPFGAFYLHVLHTPENVLHAVEVSTPGTMHGKELGGVLDALVAAINEEIGTMKVEP
ncbi:MAG: hypothetical protein Dbin4_02794, partial [Alphaproteobacteria bacterium]|nr:hypothetical protein [Alphaproteobacteria bacterium]